MGNSRKNILKILGQGHHGAQLPLLHRQEREELRGILGTELDSHSLSKLTIKNIFQVNTGTIEDEINLRQFVVMKGEAWKEQVEFF